MRALILGDPGLEPVVAEEIRELWPGSEATPDPEPLSGRTWASLPSDADFARARTIHHVIEVHHEDSVASLDDVRHVARSVDIPALVDAISFRVSAHREGEHAFSSDQLAGAVGAALQQSHGSAVDLRHFEVNVRCELFGSRLVLGVQRTPKDLSKRILRPTPLRTAVKASIAAAMLRLVGAHEGAGTLCDPMCGSGTILVEAASVNPALQVAGYDWDEDTVELARGTLANHGLDVSIECREISDLPSARALPFGFIVTDPPYGMRRGRRMRLDEFYTTMLRSCSASLARGGRVALISPRVKAMLCALADAPLDVEQEFTVRAGGLTPRVWVLQAN